MTRKSERIKAVRTTVVIIVVAHFILVNVSMAEANTIAIFRTRTGQTPGAMAIPFNNPVELASLNVSQFRRIRVCANSSGSVSAVRVRLIVIQDNDSIAELEPIVLTSGSSQTKVFDVPGVTLRVIADSAPAPGSTARNNRLDMVIYASD